MRDVTMKPTDSAKQEFYWDANGTGWRQQFRQNVARVHLDQSVRADFNPKQIACYTGVLKSTASDCRYELNADGNVVTFTTTKPLEAGGNMTLAMQFGESTFAAYKLSNRHRMLAWLVVILGSIGIVLIIVVLIRQQLLRRQNQLATIATEYLPPTDIDVFQSAVMDNRVAEHTTKIMPAGLIQLAIAHKIQITEKATKSVFSKDRDYVIKVLPNKTWTEREQAFFFAIFKTKPETGQDFELDRKDMGMGSRIDLFSKRTVLSLDGYAYDRQSTKRIILPLIAFASLSIVASAISMMISITSLESVSYENIDQPLANFYAPFSISVLQITIIAVAVSCLVWIGRFKRLTSAGMSLKAHLTGLKHYIKMAEAERLAFNQSVGGAMRDAQDRVVLYERLLPYAVMFGLEKSWGEVLNAVYQEADCVPAWYFGAQAFNASSFANSIKSFSSVASSASSSGSSGSGGGGFSGGGGGGGGGGGC